MHLITAEHMGTGDHLLPASASALDECAIGQWMRDLQHTLVKNCSHSLCDIVCLFIGRFPAVLQYAFYLYIAVIATLLAISGRDRVAGISLV